MITIESIDTPPGSLRARRVRFKEITETLTLPASVLKILSIEIGDTFPDTRDLELLVGEKSEESARARIMKLVSMRDYSTFELRKKLQEDGYTSQTIQCAIAFAQDVGAADDDRYLEAYVRSRLSIGEGQQKIFKTLRLKGFEKEQIATTFEHFMDDSIEALQLEKATRLIARSDISDYKGRDKAFRKLVARGYSFETAKAAIHAIQERRAEEIDETFHQPTDPLSQEEFID